VYGTLTALVLGALAAPGVAGEDASARVGSQDRVLTCESRTGSEQFCPAQIAGAARVVRELSSVPCIEGETWRWNPQGFYVRRGCRAQFAYRPVSTGGGGWGGGGRPTTVNCSAPQNGQVFCPAPNDGRVTLVSSSGSQQCVEGYTWRADSSGIHVRNGCNGRFNYYRLDSGGGGWRPPPGGWEPAQPIELTCESRSHRWASCPVYIQGSVQLVRQISNSPCIRNQTWGQLRNDAIWVSNGCRARFQVSGTRSTQPMRTGEGMAPPDAQISPR
jgi:hypothetical protein